MAKRKNDDNDNKSNKKRFYGRKGPALIDPNTTGLYATCTRRKEKQCKDELIGLLEEKIHEYFDIEDEKDNDGEEENKVLSIEEKIQLELKQMDSKSSDRKNDLLQPYDLGTECLLFIKTKKPIDPEILVENIMKETYETGVKTTRYTSKLIPIMNTCSSNGENPLEQLKILAKQVLKRHFHNEKNQKPLSFAIQVTKRNFQQFSSNEIIKSIAECVGKDHGHKVDLKDYDKLIIVECFKNSIGMSVVNNYLKYSKYNLQQIFDKQHEENKDD
ncbi:unnamed protein product [Candida verbasci]|uniref:THUMP domain-containing protein n=1 Tax=Candida verbasci TaxID=1227364 RepID=A0A9W4XC85_9ASCO|nr:unnamed protein product [Candida verbasci]